jgi:hypothetical protein
MRLLTDPIWSEIPANYTNGARVAQILSRAELGEPSEGWYDELFQELCHQYTVSMASYAAAPHLLRLARERPELATRLLILLGSCYAFSEPSSLAAAGDDVRKDWEQSAREAIPLVVDLLAQPGIDEEELRYLMCALAALHGFQPLAVSIEALDTV